jgi:phenylpyruvate tautomerase PptA (4-oxalocrotonate tautomerase family)
MPLLELSAFDPVYRRRADLSPALTEALSKAYGIGKEIITVYYFRIDRQEYAHAGAIPPAAADQRLFIKLHAFRRDRAKRQAAAEALTEAVVGITGIERESVIIYFFDREPDEVAHGGTLASG